MKTKICLLLTFCLIVLTNSLKSQTIEFPFGSTPTIDGSIFPGEWIDTDTIEISIQSGSAVVKVLYKHDSLNLHFAFLGNLQSTNIRFPEVLIDINNDKSSSWLNDDWWFHVSATDCEYEGQHENYDSCEVVRPNWTGVPNYTMSSTVDTVEIQIPFNTIHLNIQTTDTFGIAFDVTNTSSLWEFWPASAVMNNPSTWANATFRESSSSVVDIKKLSDEIIIYPNPNNGSFNLKLLSDLDQNIEIQIMDITGNMIYVEEVNDFQTQKELNLNLISGVYIVFVRSENQCFNEIMIVG